METLLQDIRYAFRMLVKSPGFTLTAVFTLAIGIGANTAIFSLIDQVLLRMLPVPHPEELVVLRSPGPSPGHTSSDGDDAASFSYSMYKDLRDRNPVFSGLIARFAIGLSVATGSETERAGGELVSGNYFDVLGVRPALGRVFSSEDETAPGPNPVAVLSYGYWMRRFGGNSTVLNHTVTVNGTPLTVVGVSARSFSGVQIGQQPDVFIPITMKLQMMPNARALDDRNDAFVAIIGRLKPDLTLTQAQAALQAPYRQILESELQVRKISQETRSRFLAKPLLLQTGAHGRPILQHDAQSPLLALMAMVGLVLLITCANLASLLVARGIARQRELAVRMALGASRHQIMRQLLTEPILLALAGGLVGLELGSWGLAAMVRAIPPDIGASGLNATLDIRALIFVLGLSLVAALLFGILPAITNTKLDVHDTLKEQSATASGGISRVRLRQSLIVAQVALTTVLLIAAGLFVHSLYNLRTEQLGLRPDHVIQFSIAPGLNRYSTPQSLALIERLRRNIDELPGVSSTSAAAVPVFQNSDEGSNVTVEGYTFAPNEDPHVFRNSVAPAYFSTMGTPLLAGREFAESDTAESPKVAIVNETFARRFFAGRNPVGYHFAFAGGKNVHLDIQIVGVVKDSKHDDTRDPIHPFAYVPITQNPTLSRATFYVRTQQDPLALVASLRKSVAVLDSTLPVFDLKTLTTQVNESLFVDRTVASLSVGLGLISALLAAIGLYGVMAYSVLRRTREIGIRMALGATREGVAWLVLREVVRMAGIGVLIGIPAAFGVARVVESILYDVKAVDPVTYIGAALVLGVTGFLAGSFPARRASKVDPMVALRYE